jgi:hypothetical protein
MGPNEVNMHDIQREFTMNFQIKFHCILATTGLFNPLNYQ